MRGSMAGASMGASVGARQLRAVGMGSRRPAARAGAARCAAAANADGVSIRRYPPSGKGQQSCGSVLQFEVPLKDEDKPRNILEEIVWFKSEEIVRQREKLGLAALKRKIDFAPPARDFVGRLREFAQASGKPALIAEVKKASPSKGVIKEDFDPVDIALAYEEGGAACISVLTDEKYFQGGFQNLELIRSAGCECPLLCKEFIVEAYQIFHARAMGADAILLIAAVLPNQDLSYLMKCAAALGMASLIEVHTAEEMERVLALPEAELIGINNRDLGTFKVDLANTRELLDEETRQEIERRGIVCVGESGIFQPSEVKFVQDAGVGAVLVGESLVKQDDIASAVRTLLS